MHLDFLQDLLHSTAFSPLIPSLPYWSIARLAPSLGYCEWQRQNCKSSNALTTAATKYQYWLNVRDARIQRSFLTRGEQWTVPRGTKPNCAANSPIISQRYTLRRINQAESET